MLVVHGTRKLLDRVTGPPPPGAGERSTTALGSWYATVLFWKPQVAFFMNETTLLPVFVPMAPARTLLARFPAVLSHVLEGHEISRAFIDHELEHMAETRLAPTANRSLLGSMNGFNALLEAMHFHGEAGDLVQLSLRLAETPCGPLLHSRVTPAAELMARAKAHS